ncbi:protein yellow-like [Neodiprion virginianus]|uniref:protein yellow-like n=1 Tax=Neodiprion virginianus TaxID=2961670 RepID=UPI001EE6A2CB|nr:protein yellow-like [Neodiprion virginianus]
MLRLALLACLTTTFVVAHAPFSVIFQWKTISYNWPPEYSEKDARYHYIPENNPIAGIKLWKDNMYLTIPRWKSGVPVTLARTPSTPVKDERGLNITKPKLDAYPSWDMQLAGDCNAFQSVQSMEIDPQGRMWVLDTGRTEMMGEHPTAKCPPRLVILDLDNGGAVLKEFKFPDDVARHNSSYLNDIVLDHQNGGYAYISDSGLEPAIIVYSLKDDKARKVTHDTMKAQPDAVRFVVAGTNVIQSVNVDGIALSPPGPNRTLYYSPLSSFNLYSIPVEVLQNSSIIDVQNYVVDLGNKISQSDGMVMSNTGVLYYGLLADDAIAMWNTSTSQPFATGRRTISRDHLLTQWPDTFGFDEKARLWCVVNSLQNFLNDKVDVTQYNYRIISSNAMQRSYQYLPNNTAPELPVITAAAGQIRIAMSTVFTILLVFLAC